MDIPTGFQVVIAAVAEIRHHIDIGDIHRIDEPGHVLSVSRLPSNKVLVVVYKRAVFQEESKALLLNVCSSSDPQED